MSLHYVQYSEKRSINWRLFKFNCNFRIVKNSTNGSLPYNSYYVLQYRILHQLNVLYRNELTTPHRLYDVVNYLLCVFKIIQIDLALCMYSSELWLPP